MKKYIIIAVFLFACKSKKDLEREAAKHLIDSAIATYPTYRPAPMLPPFDNFPKMYSIEERKLDTVIALLKRQNRLLENHLQASPINASPINLGTITLPPVTFTPDTTHKK